MTIRLKEEDIFIVYISLSSTGMDDMYYVISVKQQYILEVLKTGDNNFNVRVI